MSFNIWDSLKSLYTLSTLLTTVLENKRIIKIIPINSIFTSFHKFNILLFSLLFIRKKDIVHHLFGSFLLSIKKERKKKREKKKEKKKKNILHIS